MTRNVNCVILVFDITSRDSFQKLEFIYNQVSESLPLRSNRQHNNNNTRDDNHDANADADTDTNDDDDGGEEEVYIIVVGNKIDLKENRVVSSSEAQLFASKIKAQYIEVSALTLENFNRLEILLFTRLFVNYLLYSKEIADH